jgi:hypothetical protein
MSKFNQSKTVLFQLPLSVYQRLVFLAEEVGQRPNEHGVLLLMRCLEERTPLHPQQQQRKKRKKAQGNVIPFPIERPQDSA